MATIRLKTNQSRLIDNLRYAFTPRSMLGELLQNARRANASHICIDVDDISITVTDDGDGITDLQTLIHVGESGWDSELQQRENAFGLGVLSTLYFAQFLLVHSGNQAFDAATADIISGKAVKVYPELPRVGTKVRLIGVKSPLSDIKLPDWVGRELNKLCKAFPVPVSFNGINLSQPLADPTLVWRETPVGQVFIDLRAPSTYWQCFLQGLPMDYPSYWPHYQVIRLREDTLARLPDRQYLLNEETDMPRIEKAIAQAFRQALLDEKAQLSPEEFIGHYGQICLESSNADLLNDVPYALCSWFRDWEYDPPALRQPSEYYEPGGILAEETILEKGVWCIKGSGGESAIAEVYISARGGYLLRETRLDRDHWLKQRKRSIVPDEVVVIEGRHLHEDSHPKLADLRAELVLVDSLYVSLNDDTEKYSVSAVRQGNIIYFTEQAYDVTRFVDNYIIDRVFLDAKHERDEQTILTFIAVGQSSSPQQVVQALLGRRLDTPQPKLAGARVQLVFGDEGILQSVTD